MNLKYVIASLAVLPLLAFGVPARATSANLVTNGDFSSVTQGATSLIENNGYGAALTGWTTTSGYSFLLTSAQANAGFYNGYTTTSSLYTGSGTKYSISFYTVAGSPVGGNFVAQDANYLSGTLSQTISGLTVGDVYAVSFYQALAQQSSFSGATTAQWGVSLGSQSVSAPLMNDASQSFSGWSYVTVYLTATATTETLGLTASGTGGPPMALLDGVSVVDAPEPATWTVMIMGLLGIAFVRRRARSRS